MDEEKIGHSEAPMFSLVWTCYFKKYQEILAHFFHYQVFLIISKKQFRFTNYEIGFQFDNYIKFII